MKRKVENVSISYIKAKRVNFQGDKRKLNGQLSKGWKLVSKEGTDTYILRMPEYAIMHFSLGIESKSYGINEDIKNHYNLDEISIDDVERFRAEIESGKIIVEYNDLDETISFTYV
jgi:hypothetical protein